MRQGVAILIVASAIAACTSPSERLYNVAQKKVEECMKAPRAISFQSFSEVRVKKSKGGDPYMEFWCESDNAMGVPIRYEASAGFDAMTGELSYLYIDHKKAYASPENKAREASEEARMDSLLRALEAEFPASGAVVDTTRY
jgi:hypothetical protein